ncbi:MAG: TIGR02206 family membrane protein [Chloroflexota bacterium]
MEQFIAKDFNGAPFQLFGIHHLVALGIILLINVALLWRGKQIPQRWRMPLRITLAVILVVDEALWHLWNWYIGAWTVQTMLPLHLCSLLVFLSAIMLINGNMAIYEFIYFLGIGGAMQAILTPDAGPYGFPHFRFFQVFVSHGAIVTAGVFMTAVEGYRPYPKSILHVAVIGNLYMAFVAVVNWLLGSNYLFIAHKPETASVLDLLPPWPAYILIMELMAVVMVLLLYTPFAWQDWQTRRAAKAAASIS